MEVVLRMKLIDFGLIFSFIFFCIVSIFSFKNDLLYSNSLKNIMYNNCVDEITYSALKASFNKVDLDGNPVIDKEVLSECLLSNMAILYNNTSINSYLSSNYLLGVLTIREGFYVFHNGLWSKLINYSEGNNTSHPNKVKEISEYIEDNFGNKLLFATNEGEAFKNTLNDYSFICIYENRSIKIDNQKYGVYFISGAAIVES